MNILVTGANGQLGSEIRELSSNYPQLYFFFEGSKSLDVSNFDDVNEYIQSNKITAIINCAAYTAVDTAEKEIKKATQINVTGVFNLGKAIEQNGGKLIHISTDYVFSGESFIPYTENNEVNPEGVYGKTKLAGEEALLNLSIEAIIIRTSWLYSSYGNNFVKTMLRLGKEKENLNVVFDQIGTPTYAKNLAKTCIDVLVKEEKIDKKNKIYHYSNEGVASWYDFAKAIMTMSKTDCNVHPITTNEYPTTVKRPQYSVMNKSRIKKDFNVEIPYWRDSLKECINELQKG
ncbi:dTDP-4-dehydrorhamnose reductase [Tenacibaculum haliotis]|uniref:dTDP-4-dehydrorhamnose reductase n=1 Tax=Tenacibaculum haliotis TaxID=1888914 RepID=UPI0021AFD21E|nr:dTDP-4-dehydrorhamnose reductase [Tenacibaculum haliotis]MCT4699774.1 dTDP-4-dehydrorhamnose reductase [Tenacibaculum haliotis]